MRILGCYAFKLKSNSAVNNKNELLYYINVVLFKYMILL